MVWTRSSSFAARIQATKRPLGLVVLTGGLLAGVLVPALPGAALPGVSIDQVKAELAALHTQEQQVTEQFDAAQVALAAANQQVQVAHDEVSRQSQVTARYRSQVSRMAAAAYMGGGVSTDLSALTMADPQSFINQTTDLEQVSRNQSLALHNFLVQARVLAGTQLAARQAQSAAASVARQIAAARARVEAAIAAEQALLNRLTAAQQAALAAAQQAQQVASRSVVRVSLASIPADGRAAAAVQFAYAQLGKPYQWGGAGPDSYDCSGLTMQAWAAAGVYLPHSAAGQQSMVTPVAPGDLQAGDLIFFGAPAYHVGIYIGNGNMINAPYTGTVVRVDSIGGYTSAGRP